MRLGHRMKRNLSSGTLLPGYQELQGMPTMYTLKTSQCFGKDESCNFWQKIKKKETFKLWTVMCGRPLTISAFVKLNKEFNYAMEEYLKGYESDLLPAP